MASICIKARYIKKTVQEWKRQRGLLVPCHSLTQVVSKRFCVEVALHSINLRVDSSFHLEHPAFNRRGKLFSPTPEICRNIKRGLICFKDWGVQISFFILLRTFLSWKMYSGPWRTSCHLDLFLPPIMFWDRRQKKEYGPLNRDIFVVVWMRKYTLRQPLGHRPEHSLTFYFSICLWLS